MQQALLKQPAAVLPDQSVVIGHQKDQFPPARAVIIRNQIGPHAVRRGVLAVHADGGIEVQMEIGPRQVRRIGGDGLLQLRLDRGPPVRRRAAA